MGRDIFSKLHVHRIKKQRNKNGKSVFSKIPVFMWTEPKKSDFTA